MATKRQKHRLEAEHRKRKYAAEKAAGVRRDETQLPVSSVYGNKKRLKASRASVGNVRPK